MNARLPNILAFALATWSLAAQPQTPPAPQSPTPQAADVRYAKRVEPRYLDFAGSGENLASITTGLRHGTEFTITGGAESATIVPPTKPMGYGNITRALDLASRDLLAHGITDPTPAQISAALNGGPITTADGSTTELSGVLKLRSEGSGWGQIAHTLKLHPGLGSAKAAPPVPSGASASSDSAAGTTTAPAGGTRTGPVRGAASGTSRGSTTTALGNRIAQPGARQGNVRSRSSFTATGHATGAGTAGGMVTAGGGRASANGSIARGQNGHGRGGKN